MSSATNSPDSRPSTHSSAKPTLPTIAARRMSVAPNQALQSAATVKASAFQELDADGNTKESERASFEIHQASFNPFEASSYQICISGAQIFRVLRFTPDQPVGLRLTSAAAMYKTFTRHTWLTKEKIAVGTNDGSIWIAEAGELKHELLFAPKSLDLEQRQRLYRRRPTMPATGGLSVVPESGPASPEMGGYDSDEVTYLLAHQEGFLVGFKSGLIGAFETVNADSNTAGKLNKDDLVSGFRQIHDWNSSSLSKSSEVTLSGLNRVTSLALTPSEDFLVCLQSDHQMSCINFNTPISAALSTNYATPEGAESGHSVTLDFKLEYLMFEHHREPITDMSVCPHKSLVVTCSRDRTIKIWNFVDSTLELSQRFAELPLSVSLHPSGSFLLVGFQTSVKLFSILIGGLVPIWEASLMGCHRVNFSNGGHCFAVASEFTIFIYDTFRQDVIAKHDAHAGDIKNILWSSLDRFVLTTGQNGLCYEWEFLPTTRAAAMDATANNLNNLLGATLGNTLTNKWRRSPNTPSGGGDTAVAQTQTGKTSPFTFRKVCDLHLEQTTLNQSTFTYHESKRKMINANEFPLGMSVCADGSIQQAYLKGTQKFDMPMECLHLTYNVKHHWMISSSSTGSLIGFKFPVCDGMGKPVRQLDFVEFAGHRGPASHVLTSSDGKFLFSTGFDGTFLISRIISRDASTLKWNNIAHSQNTASHRRQSVVTFAPGTLHRKTSIAPGTQSSVSLSQLLTMQDASQYSDEVLTSRSDYSSRLQAIKDLQEAERQFKEQAAAEMRLKELTLQERVQEVEKEFEVQLQAIKNDIAQTQKQRQDGTNEYNRAMNAQLTIHERENNGTRSDYERRTQNEMNKFNELSQKMKHAQEQFEIRLGEAKDTAALQLSQLKQSYEDRLKQMADKVQEIKIRTDELGVEYQRFEHDLEEEVDQEINEMKAHYEKRLIEERTTTAECLQEFNATREQFMAFQRVIANNNAATIVKQETIRKLQLTINRLQSEYDSLAKDLKEKLASEQEKDRNIKDELKRKQDLEKTEFMLANRISSEKAQIKPREERRLELKMQTSEMKDEMKDLVSVRKQYHVGLKQLNTRLVSIEKQVVRERQRVMAFRMVMERIRDEFAQVMEIVDQMDRVDGQEKLKLAALLKKSAVEFFHRQCSRKRSQIQLAPKGCVQPPPSTEDPAIERAMNVPFLIAASQDNLSLPLIDPNENTTEEKKEQDLQPDAIWQMMNDGAFAKKSWVEEAHYTRDFKHREILTMNRSSKKGDKESIKEMHRHMREADSLLTEYNILKHEYAVVQGRVARLQMQAEMKKK